MPSEYAPGGSKPRMTNAQIRKLQKQQQYATKIASEKIAKAKKSDEWKKEEEILNSLENVLESDKLIIKWNINNISQMDIKEQKKEASFLQKIIQFFKNLF